MCDDSCDGRRSRPASPWAVAVATSVSRPAWAAPVSVPGPRYAERSRPRHTRPASRAPPTNTLTPALTRPASRQPRAGLLDAGITREALTINKPCRKIRAARRAGRSAPQRLRHPPANRHPNSKSAPTKAPKAHPTAREPLAAIARALPAVFPPTSPTTPADPDGTAAPDTATIPVPAVGNTPVAPAHADPTVDKRGEAIASAALPSGIATDTAACPTRTAGSPLTTTANGFPRRWMPFYRDSRERLRLPASGCGFPNAVGKAAGWAAHAQQGSLATGRSDESPN